VTLCQFESDLRHHVLGTKTPVDRNLRGFFFTNVHGLATNFFCAEFFRHKLCARHQGNIPSGRTLRVGGRQREREGYRAGSEGVVAESLERSYPWPVGSFFGNTELSLELWTVIAGISGFDD